MRALDGRCLLRLGGFRFRRIRVYAERQGDVERRADAQFALKADFAAHLLGKLLGNRQPQPRALVGSARAGFLLRERLKRVLLERRAHAASRVGAGEKERRRRAVKALLLAGDGHAAAGAVVLDRIAHNVLQHLMQVHRRANQILVIPRQRLAGHLHVFAPRLPLHRRHNFPDHLAQVERLLLQRHRAGFELVHVQHIVDQIQQEARCGHDFLAALFLLCFIARISAADFHHAADAVNRRADVVAHAAQEVRFGDVGALGVLRRLFQLQLIVAFALLLRRHVLRHHQHRFKPTAAVVVLRQRRHQVHLVRRVAELQRQVRVLLQSLRQGRQVAVADERLAEIRRNVLSRLHLHHFVHAPCAVHLHQPLHRVLDDAHRAALHINKEREAVDFADGADNPRLLAVPLQCAAGLLGAQPREAKPSCHVNQRAVEENGVAGIVDGKIREHGVHRVVLKRRALARPRRHAVSNVQPPRFVPQRMGDVVRLKFPYVAPDNFGAAGGNDGFAVRHRDRAFHLKREAAEERFQLHVARVLFLALSVCHHKARRVLARDGGEIHRAVPHLRPRHVRLHGVIHNLPHRRLFQNRLQHRRRVPVNRRLDDGIHVRVEDDDARQPLRIGVLVKLSVRYLPRFRDA